MGAVPEIKLPAPLKLSALPRRPARTVSNPLLPLPSDRDHRAHGVIRRWVDWRPAGRVFHVADDIRPPRLRGVVGVRHRWGSQWRPRRHLRAGDARGEQTWAGWF